MATEKKFHVGVKALIENDKGQILLLHEARVQVDPHLEHWDFPGGRMEDGEKVIDTLKREIQEESGIEKIFGASFVASVISNHEIKLKDGEIVGLVLMVYRVKVAPEAKIVLSDEHHAYEWVGRAEAKKRLAHKYPEEFIKQL
jgi:8-oxo-dGTP diphosphatase